MEILVRTTEDLHSQGLSNDEIALLCRRLELTELLPHVYCRRVPPTTMDKCHAVVRALPGAVLSHGTAAWLHGIWTEPGVIEAYVAQLPDWPVPRWLRLHLAEFVDDEPELRAATVPHSGHEE